MWIICPTENLDCIHRLRQILTVMAGAPSNLYIKCLVCVPPRDNYLGRKGIVLDYAVAYVTWRAIESAGTFKTNFFLYGDKYYERWMWQLPLDDVGQQLQN